MAQSRQLTKTSQQELSSPPKSSTKTTEVAASLARLALHYWRPDFTPAQAKLLLADFLHDLQGYPPKDVEYACAAYRQNPENRFYPTPGQLLEILKRYDPPRSRPTYRAPRVELQVAANLPERLRELRRSLEK